MAHCILLSPRARVTTAGCVKDAIEVEGDALVLDLRSTVVMWTRLKCERVLPKRLAVAAEGLASPRRFCRSGRHTRDIPLYPGG